MNDQNQLSESSPCAVLGAGDLVTHLYRAFDPDGAVEYRFNVFRFDQCMQATHQLRHCDLRDIVKLCHVVTFAVLDDGWASPQQREQLTQLLVELERVTEAWNNEHGPHATT